MCGICPYSYHKFKPKMYHNIGEEDEDEGQHVRYCGVDNVGEIDHNDDYVDGGDRDDGGGDSMIVHECDRGAYEGLGYMRNAMVDMLIVQKVCTFLTQHQQQQQQQEEQ